MPKYDWREKLVYITPAAHRVLTKEEQFDNNQTILTTKDDNHFVVIRPKAFVPSTASVWASETVMLRHNHPDIFESKTLVNTSYTPEFKTLCAKIHDFTFQYCDMSERGYLAKVTSTADCPHRAYENQRASHALCNLTNALREFSAALHPTEHEKMILAKPITPNLSPMLDSLKKIADNVPHSHYLEMNNDVISFRKMVLQTLNKLQLPPVKPRWAQLTDAGPGVGVSNILVRFSDAELVRLFNTDLRECHRSRDDSGQNEAERSNRATGDVVVDGSTIEWEVEKRFRGMTSEEIETMS